MMGGEYAGDWNCPECGAMVFASKNACYKCKAPKPAGSDGGGGYGGGGYGGACSPTGFLCWGVGSCGNSLASAAA